jgi:hypothetical protein
MTDDDETRLLEVLESIHAGKLLVSAPDGVPEEGNFYGDILFETSNGWKITVFDDGDSFDYIDQVVTPEGVLFDFDDFWRLAETADGEITPRTDSRNRVRNYRGCSCGLTNPLSWHNNFSGCEKEVARVWGIPWDGQEEAKAE